MGFPVSAVTSCFSTAEAPREDATAHDVLDGRQVSRRLMAPLGQSLKLIFHTCKCKAKRLKLQLHSANGKVEGDQATRTAKLLKGLRNLVN